MTLSDFQVGLLVRLGVGLVFLIIGIIISVCVHYWGCNTSRTKCCPGSEDPGSGSVELISYGRDLLQVWLTFTAVRFKYLRQPIEYFYT